MIKLNIKDLDGKVMCTSSMTGTGLEIKNEIVFAPAALLEQFVNCLKQNDVPDEVIRRQLTEVVEHMTETMKERMLSLVKDGEDDEEPV